MANEMIVCDTPEQLEAYFLLVNKSAAKLEVLGMRHSSGKSVIAALKREYGFKGNKQAVYDQYCQMLRDMGILKS